MAFGHLLLSILALSSYRPQGGPGSGGGPAVDGIELREDGGHELREDGGLELRE